MSIVSRRIAAATRVAFVVTIVALIAGCASAPPSQQADLCEVFEQYPDWYDYARDSADKWGTPIHVLMAFVRHESSYRAKAKPPFRWFLFIPLGRASSAKGYAQAQDPVWGRVPGGARPAVQEPLRHGGRARLHRLVQLQDLARSECAAYRCVPALPCLPRGAGAVSSAVPGRRSPGCSNTRNASGIPPTPTSRSSHVAKGASAATRGTRSGRSAADGREKASPPSGQGCHARGPFVGGHSRESRNPVEATRYVKFRPRGNSGCFHR